MSKTSEDYPNKLSSALGELVKKLSDPYFSDKEKEINIFVRFVVAASGVFCYTVLIFIFRFDKWELIWDPNLIHTIYGSLLLALICIGGFSLYLGLLISLTKFHYNYSYIRLFLAGVLLPAIVFTLIPG